MAKPPSKTYNMPPLNNSVGLSVLFAFSNNSFSEKPRNKKIAAMYNAKTPSNKLTARFL